MSLRLLILVAIFLLTNAPSLAKAYYKPIHWVKRSKLLVELKGKRKGISVAGFLSTKEGKSRDIVDVINCSYFWISKGQYWPVGLTKIEGKDWTSKLMPSRGFGYYDPNRGFDLSWRLPPKTATVVFQGHLIVMDGKIVKKNGGFKRHHWRMNCKRSIVAIRKDKYGVEYAGAVHAQGDLTEISNLLIKKERVIKAVNNDGDTSCSKKKPVSTILVLREIEAGTKSAST